MAKKIGLKNGPNLYKYAVKKISRNRLRKSIANSLRARYFPKKQENIRLSRARRKQKYPAPKPAVMIGCLHAGSPDSKIVSSANFHTQLGGDVILGGVMVSLTPFEKSTKEER